MRIAPGIVTLACIQFLGCSGPKAAPREANQ